LVVLLSFNTFYSYSIFFTNLLIFSSIFIIHSINIRHYTEKLTEYVKNNTEELTTESVIKDYSELKAQHTKSVSKLNNMFSSITVIGILSGYFMSINFGTKFLGIFNYIEIVCFLITEAIYLYSISRVKLSSSGVASIINSPLFVSRFLSRSPLEEFASDIIFNNSDEIEEIKENNNLVRRTSKNNDLMIMEKINNNLSNHGKTKKIDFIKDLSIRSVIKNHENAESLDWIVLNFKLNSPWENFKLFGFEIEDTTLIQKTTAVLTGLLMLLHLNDTFLS